MSQHLQDKVVLVTGAGGGFGQLIAEKCAAGGARVVGVDIVARGTRGGVRRDRGGRAVRYYQVADVTDMDQMHAAVQHAVQTFGAVDVIVNNAGVMPLAFFADHDKAWRAVAPRDRHQHQRRGERHLGRLRPDDRAGPRPRRQHLVDLRQRRRGGIGRLQRHQGRGHRAVGLVAHEAKGKIKVTTVKPTGVLGTNLGSGVVNGAAIMGIVGTRRGATCSRSPRSPPAHCTAEQTDIDSVKYWLITPEDLAEAVVMSSTSRGASASATSPCGPAEKITSTDRG